MEHDYNQEVIFMGNEHGSWIMRGLSWNDPFRIRTYKELINWVNEIGFLPLFSNSIPGFSAEELVSPDFWWTGDREQDPWEWREIIAESREVAYGKFFAGKSGFVSVDWLSYLANYRRDGYDFDSAYEDGLISRRDKKIMDCFGILDDDDRKEVLLPGYIIKHQAGFGKEGFKNFNGCMTGLQMETYIVRA